MRTAAHLFFLSKANTVRFHVIVAFQVKSLDENRSSHTDFLEVPCVRMARTPTLHNRSLMH